jgi:hypothetical protein
LFWARLKKNRKLVRLRLLARPNPTRCRLSQRPAPCSLSPAPPPRSRPPCPSRPTAARYNALIRQNRIRRAAGPHWPLSSTRCDKSQKCSMGAWGGSSCSLRGFRGCILWQVRGNCRLMAPRSEHRPGRAVRRRRCRGSPSPPPYRGWCRLFRQLPRPRPRDHHPRPPWLLPQGLSPFLLSLGTCFFLRRTHAAWGAARSAVSGQPFTWATPSLPRRLACEWQMVMMRASAVS